MRDSIEMLTSEQPISAANEEKSWSLPGAVLGFLAWLLVLGIPFVLYGLNTLFFFLYTWPFFLALMPVSIILGIAIHSLLQGKLLISAVATLCSVAVLFSVLLIWLLG